MASLNLSDSEYKLAKEGKHPKFEVNKAVIDLLNRTEQIRMIMVQRSQVKADIDRIRKLEEKVTFERVKDVPETLITTDDTLKAAIENYDATSIGSESGPVPTIH